MTFDIEAGPLDRALKAYAERLHSQMLYDARLVAGRRVPALRARLRRDSQVGLGVIHGASD